MKKIEERLGISGISAYTARHSYATVLKRSGANIAIRKFGICRPENNRKLFGIVRTGGKKKNRIASRIKSFCNFAVRIKFLPLVVKRNSYFCITY